MVYNSNRYIVDFGGTELLICYFIVRPIKSARPWSDWLRSKNNHALRKDAPGLIETVYLNQLKIMKCKYSEDKVSMTDHA